LGGHIIGELLRISGRAGHCEFADDRIDVDRPPGCGLSEGLIAAAAEIDPVILKDARGPGQGCGNSSDRLAGESENIGKLTHGFLHLASHAVTTVLSLLVSVLSILL
jgi:hypothetical protein